MKNDETQLIKSLLYVSMFHFLYLSMTPTLPPISHSSELFTSGGMLKELQRFNFDEIRALRSSLIIQTIEATCESGSSETVEADGEGVTPSAAANSPRVTHNSHGITHTHPQLIGLHVCMMLY